MYYIIIIVSLALMGYSASISYAAVDSAKKARIVGIIVLVAGLAMATYSWFAHLGPLPMIMVFSAVFRGCYLVWKYRSISGA